MEGEIHGPSNPHVSVNVNSSGGVSNSNKSPILIFIIIFALIGILAGVTVTNRGGGNNEAGNQEAVNEQEKESQLVSGAGSVNTILYGYKEREEAVSLRAVNDNGSNNVEVGAIAQSAKFVTPIKGGKYMIFIGGLDQGDKGKTIQLQTIRPASGETAGAATTLYTAVEGYGIDILVTSENNEWIAWSENKPQAGSIDTHANNYFRSFKANISSVINGTSKTITPIPLVNEHGTAGVTVRMPAVITDSGQVYFNGIQPIGYYIHDGFTDESKQVILAKNTYNSKPYLFQDRYIMYTSFSSSNNPKLAAVNVSNGRQEVINRNIVKVSDLQSKGGTPVVAAPGDAGEHYNHPVYVSGEPTGDLQTVVEVYQKDPTSAKIVQKEIQLVTKKAAGGYQKDTIAAVPAGMTYRILSVGELPNGHKTVVVGDESANLGNLGSGSFVSSSGYEKMLSGIKVYDVESKSGAPVSETVFSNGAGEYLGQLPKTESENLAVAGVDVSELIKSGRNKDQLQLETFVPVEPKRQRVTQDAKPNSRKECESIFEELGMGGNPSECVACPIYVYSDKVEEVTIKPKTSIYESTAVPAIYNNSWSFVADKLGNLVFPDGTRHHRIDFLFPRTDISLPTEGTILSKSEYESGIKAYARSLGFSAQEAADASEYFVPQLEESNYVFLSHLNARDTKNLLDVEVTPKPSVQESRIFYFKKLSARPATDPTPSVTTPIVRGTGLTVVTWGGIVE